MPKRPPTEEQQRKASQEEFLREKGWKRVANGWRHPRLETNWGHADALKLQQEADEGRQDPVCRTIREEVWP